FHFNAYIFRKIDNFQDISLHTIKAILILDNDGRRIIAKYYGADSMPSVKEQRAFETSLFAKTSKNLAAEIVMFEGYTCVFKSNVDLIFYVIGDAVENELILSNTLNTLYDAVSQILKKNVEKRALLDSLDLVFLAIDELCDSGIVLETDSIQLVSRVGSRLDDTQQLEGSVTQVLQQAKEQFKWSLLK
uniref:Coatomer subunit zeta n=2 Tax=Macrostomum lignano TaxID=282301 RepID=A0A1I8HV69_9PLAT